MMVHELGFIRGFENSVLKLARSSEYLSVAFVLYSFVVTTRTSACHLAVEMTSGGSWPPGPTLTAEAFLLSDPSRLYVFLTTPPRVEESTVMVLASIAIVRSWLAGSHVAVLGFATAVLSTSIVQRPLKSRPCAESTTSNPKTSATPI